MAAEFDEVLLLHGAEQAADCLAVGVQLVGDLLMGDIEGFGIECTGAFLEVVQELLIHVAECNKVNDRCIAGR